MKVAMAAAPTTCIVFLVLSLAVLARANIGLFDEYWQKRAAEAEETALASYTPVPEEVTQHINGHVYKALNTDSSLTLSGKGKNSTTRRNLRRLPRRRHCKATNPIDRCWRCQPNWADNRKKLADCVLGFGRETVGGKYGKFYVVTDGSDDDLLSPKPGTLRHAVTRTGPLWITFARSMVIRLKQELIMTSDKTIDGRGAEVHIAYGCGFTLQFIKNVIIHGLHIHDVTTGSGGDIIDSEGHHGIRTQSDGDGISIYGSSNIWVDHVSMSNCADGLVDAIEGSTAITISNSHFTHHNEVMLFGASDMNAKDAIMQITVAFNHFGRGLVQRMPRCRWGFFHVLNNDYTHWLMYAIGGSTHPTIISQGNRFIAPPNQAAKEITKRDYATPDEWKNWIWRSEKDMLMNGAFFVQSGQAFNKKRFTRQDMINAKPGTFVTRLTRFAGTLYCKPNMPC